MSRNISRRDVLKGSALLATAATLGFPGVFGLRSASASAADDDIPTIINVAATAETFATTHYYRALTTKTLTMNPQEQAYFVAAMYAEFVHLQFLQSNGAKTLTTKFFFPKVTFSSLKVVGQITSVAETVFVGAYIAATNRFAALNQPALAAVAAQVAVVEGQHLLFMRQIAGEKLPNDIVLANAIFENVSDAVPVVQPLLDGKKPASGPLAVDFETAAYEYPGDDKVQALVDKMLDKKLLADVKPWTAMGASMAATMAPTMSK